MANTIQPYAWGSHTSFTELFGIANPNDTPMAELWMGAHPKAPSFLEIGGRRVSLVDHIAADPATALGSKAAATYHDRLPFLFKVLAAAQPLSIQAHPALGHAQDGFADEENRRIPREAPDRNYRDDNHKPELICAITEFWGMRGFRTVKQIVADFGESEFAQLSGSLSGQSKSAAVVLPQNDNEIGRFFQGLMEADDGTRFGLVDAAVSMARRRWGASPGPELPDVNDTDARFFWVLILSEHYPGDIGVLAPLYLNVFALRPGEATYQPAGVLHAYMHGTGMEIMANSDNVLRGGLTPKHIDVDELLAVGVFNPEPQVVLRGESSSSDFEVVYDAPFAEFRLSRIDVAGTVCQLAAKTAAQILFCDRGSVDVRCRDTNDEESITLAAGESAFVDAVAGSLDVSGRGSLFRAMTGERQA